MSGTQYQLSMSQFNIRFQPIFRMQDIFGRQYLICTDDRKERKVICKNYSIQSQAQKQDVLQNMSNFIKLNSIDGISKIIAFAESGGELSTAFQYDGKILSQFMQDFLSNENSSKSLKNSKDGRVVLYNLYTFLTKGLIKIIGNTIQVGMQLDDISRDNIIIYEPSIFSSSSSIQEDLKPVLKILFDQRQKDYQFLINPNIFPQSNQVKRFPNKLYWSADKIVSQIIDQEDFMNQDGLQSVYMIGLLLLDIIYECESYHTDSAVVDRKKRDFELIDPDSSLLNVSQLKKSYYKINKQMGSVERDEAFISHKLNFIHNSQSQILKHFGVLIRNMIMPVPEMRYDLLKVEKQIERIQKLVKFEQKLNKNVQISDNDSHLKQKIQPSQQIFSFREDQDHNNNVKNSYESENSQNKGVKQSLKYSQNSLSLNEDFKSLSNEGNFKITKNTQQFGSIRKQIQVPLSSTTLTDSPSKYKFQTSNTSKTGFSTEHIGGNSERKIISERQQEYYQSPQSSRHQAVDKKTRSSMNKENILKSCRCTDKQYRDKLEQTVQQIRHIQQTGSTIAKKDYVDGSYYYGCYNPQNNKRIGLGIYVYKVGDIYFGNWVDNSLPNGCFLFKNGESYEGPIKSGKQGIGKYKYANGNIYQGQWQDDLKHGKGVMLYANGASYDGEWVKGKKHGVGAYFYQNGLEYKGGFVLGKKYGNGTFFFTNGTKISGFWENNCLEGKAIVQYYNGDRFQGNFHQSEKNGQGHYKWKLQQNQHVQYIGDFKKDNLEGQACIIFQKGQKYEGYIKNGRRQGQGTYYYKNGDIFIGIWKQDMKQMGKYTFHSGEVFEGKFKNGQISFGTLNYINNEIYQGEFFNGQRHGVGNYITKQKKVLEGRWNRDQFVGQGLI